jgi:hypothetical protein
MEASLALADLLFKVGHADAASQLLLGGVGDAVRLAHYRLLTLWGAIPGAALVEWYETCTAAQHCCHTH